MLSKIYHRIEEPDEAFKFEFLWMLVNVFDESLDYLEDRDEDGRSVHKIIKSI